VGREERVALVVSLDVVVPPVLPYREFVGVVDARRDRRPAARTVLGDVETGRQRARTAGCDGGLEELATGQVGIEVDVGGQTCGCGRGNERLLDGPNARGTYRRRRSR
jgi:predicted transcriptional regulator